MEQIELSRRRCCEAKDEFSNYSENEMKVRLPNSISDQEVNSDRGECMMESESLIGELVSDPDEGVFVRQTSPIDRARESMHDPHFNFIVEEVADSESTHNTALNPNGLEMRIPNPAEGSKSDNSPPPHHKSNFMRHTNFRPDDCYHRVHKIENVFCDPNTGSATDTDTDNQLRRRFARKKKRWSVGLLKRPHSIGVGGGDCDVDAMDAHDIASSARRLRRRIRGPEKSPLIVKEATGIHVGDEGQRIDGHCHFGLVSSPKLATGDGFNLETSFVFCESMDIKKNI